MDVPKAYIETSCETLLAASGGTGQLSMFITVKAIAFGSAVEL